MNSRSIQSALLLFLFSMLVIVSCKKDMKNDDNNNQTQSNPFAIPAVTPVTGSVSGIVVDENNTPVNGAEIKLGAATATSDSKGLFSFNNTTLDKYVTTVTVEKTGYFKGYRSFSANATRNYLNIKLIPKILSGTVTSSTGGAITLTNGTNLSFQANSLVIKSTGAPYTGTVNVYASYIDPTASDISAVVPGSFMGTDGSSLFSLQSTGMIAVDLESTSGQSLQLVSNLPATIKLPIPSSLLSKAPATINTWSLNEQGVWTKEGTATKSGNFYEMQATHFSFWNCDVPANAIYLTLHLQDQNGNALVNTLVSLTIPNNTTWWATTYGYTDSLGNVSGLVPGGLSLEMNVFPNPYSCTGPIFTQTIGPFTTNAAQTITVTVSPSQELTVTGTVIDCNSNPLQNGTAIITTDQNTYYYTSIVNGSYTTTITYCTPITSLNVSVIDNVNGGQGSSGTITVSGNSVTVPSISSCGTSPTAVFTFGNGQGSCQMGTSIGTYTAGLPLTVNAVTVMVNVTTPGTYAITTTTADGFTFAGSGVFTQTGPQTVVLGGTGTPTNAGTYTFLTQTLGFTGCNFIISVGATQPPQAIIDLGGPSTCGNYLINGNYITGIALNNNNTITVTVVVSSPGTYNIFTNDINGINFSDSGIISTGTQTIVLQGSGTPLSGGLNTYTLMSSTGTTGCTFNINTNGTGGQAVLSFDGAPGTCSLASPNGPFTAGSILTGQSTVTISVNIITPGTYAINTATADGFSFYASGVATTTGPMNITLIGQGTPTFSGTYTFAATDGVASGCVFIVPVN